MENPEIIKQTVQKPILVAGNMTSAPAVTCAHAAPVVKCMIPVSTVAYTASSDHTDSSAQTSSPIQRVQKMAEVPQIQFIDNVRG